MRPASNADATRDLPDPPQDGAGSVIGRYQLTQLLGEGGFGSVFLAEQHHPVRRTLALKVIKSGMDTRQVIARFEAERQALAMMDHPSIAAVVDAGATPAGRPFFVMELVRGVPVTDYCDEHRLSINQRIELLMQVCHGVHHAHQKGIIHRDLKPTNVLVSLHEGKPLPKIIDFGLAKALHFRLTDASLHTGAHEILGTPSYMSPEQAHPSQLDIDTRADVYALGVMLFQLLTGSTPHSLRNLSREEALRVVRESDCPRPSARVSEIASSGRTGPSAGPDSVQALSHRRRCEPAQFLRRLRGDLDWIVLKCLDKDRSRRYDSASALAEDLQRHLTHQPVTAGPPTASYRIRKFVRRNRQAVFAAGVGVSLLLGGIVATTWMASRASAAEKQAIKERDDKDKALTAERHASELARKRLGQIERGNEILASLLRDLNPATERQGGPMLREQLAANLGKAAKQIELAEIADPLTAARLQLTLAGTYSSLDYHSEAIGTATAALRTFDSQLGPDHPDTLRAMTFLASAYSSTGHRDAVPLAERVFERRKATLGDEHRDTFASMKNLAGIYLQAGRHGDALPLFERAFELRKPSFGDDSGDVGLSMGLGLAYHSAGRLTDMLALYTYSLDRLKPKLGEHHVSYVQLMRNLGIGYSKAGRFKEAIPILEQVRERLQNRLGEHHHDTLEIVIQLAHAYRNAMRFDDALPLYTQTLERQRAKLGDNSLEVRVSVGNLAQFYQEAGRHAEAVALFERKLEMDRAAVGEDHRTTLWSMRYLADAYRGAGRLRDALPLGELALKKLRAKFGDDHGDTLDSMRILAGCYSEAGRSDDALPLYEHVFAKHRAKLGDDHLSTLTSISNLAWAYKKARRYDAAIPLYEKASAKYRAGFGEEHPSTLASMLGLAEMYEATGRPDAARELRNRVLHIQSQPERRALESARAAKDPKKLAQALIVLARFLSYDGDHAGAEPLFREAVELERAAAAGPTMLLSHWLYDRGLNSLNQRKFAEAEADARESLQIRLDLMPDGSSWWLDDNRSLIGGALVGQRRFAEAEPLLVAACTNMAKKKGVTLPRHREALQRLVKLYDDWGKPEQAGPWKLKLGELAPRPATRPAANATGRG